jgi:hypothetical protein
VLYHWQTSSLKAPSVASSLGSGGDGSQRESSKAQNSVVCGWNKGTHSFINDFMCFFRREGGGFLIVRLHAGYR